MEDKGAEFGYFNYVSEDIKIIADAEQLRRVVYNIISNSMKYMDKAKAKINLRVNKNTPERIYELGTELTKAGLGFPQYCNDDIVVPGLMKLGYDREDALNYSVAACWEFIIPKYTVSFDLLGEGEILRTGVASFLAANLVNNIPMSVLFSSVVAPSGAASVPALYAAVIGSNIGAFFTPLGALAGIMWMALLRQYGVKLSFGKFVIYGAVISVPTLLATLGGLWLVLL